MGHSVANGTPPLQHFFEKELERSDAEQNRYTLRRNTASIIKDLIWNSTLKAYSLFLRFIRTKNLIVALLYRYAKLILLTYKKQSPKSKTINFIKQGLLNHHVKKSLVFLSKVIVN